MGVLGLCFGLGFSVRQTRLTGLVRERFKQLRSVALKRLLEVRRIHDCAGILLATRTDPVWELGLTQRERKPVRKPVQLQVALLSCARNDKLIPCIESSTARQRHKLATPWKSLSCAKPSAPAKAPQHLPFPWAGLSFASCFPGFRDSRVRSSM